MGLRTRLRSRRELRNFAGSSGGGAAIEFAVALPVLILMLIGATDFGRVYYMSLAVANAARAGAEYGAQGNAYAVDSVGQTNFAKQDGVEAGAITVSAQRVCRCGSAVAGCTTICAGYGEPKVFVSVTASRAINLILPYPGVPNNIVVSRTATFRVQ